MAPRRSFLGVLIAMWPFGRAVAGGQTKPPKTEETPCPPADGEEVMKQALSECREDAWKGCNQDLDKEAGDVELAKDAQALKDLEKRCERDFKDQLCHQNDKETGKNCWDSDGGKVRSVATLVGRTARFAAIAEGSKVVTEKHLVAALKFLQPFCYAGACVRKKSLRGGEEKTLRAYCEKAAAG